MKRSTGSLLPRATALALAGCAAPGPRLAPGTDLQAGCQSLNGYTIDSERIVWPGLSSGRARVESATWNPGTPLSTDGRGPTPEYTVRPATPAHCQLVGIIAPIDPKAEPIRFQVNLPANWNGRSLQYGGGGFNGTLVDGLGLLPAQRYDSASPLAKGYVTVGTDSGHQSRPGESPMRFALNDEMLANFAHAAYPKVRNVSLELMKAAYGRAPKKFYFFGSSEGGREGLMMAQRYPQAFNGIFSRVPVINWTGLQFAGVRNGMALMNGGWIEPAQVSLIQEKTLAACDAADGLVDGVISDPVGCLKRFDPASLRCASGAAAKDCLSDAQVKAVQTLRAPYRFPYPLANGVTEYPGWGIGGEAAPPAGPGGGWLAWWSGRAAPTLPPTPDNGIAWVFGSGVLQHFFARDPNADPRQVTPEHVAARVAEVSALMDATSPDLREFQRLGGKLIMLEYMSDYAQSPFAGAQYLKTVQERLGPRQPDEFMRLYTAPGVDHMGGGAPARVDFLDALAEWTETGRRMLPDEVVEQRASPPFTVIRSRPLCEWPRWPKYVGGDDNDARSFVCFF